MALAEQGMKVGLRALNGFAGLELLDRLRLREPAEKLIYRATRQSARTAGRVGRAFNGGAAKRSDPARLAAAKASGLFDLTPTDEQQMLRESFGSFAAEKLRPAALEADAKSAAPDGLLKERSELGVTVIGVPEELGGVFHERSSTSAVLVAETLAHGDM